jgi:hypothetical protein
MSKQNKWLQGAYCTKRINRMFREGMSLKKATTYANKMRARG